MYIAHDVLGDNFRLTGRPDLILELYSLQHEYYIGECSHAPIRTQLEKHGFRRTREKGSTYRAAPFQKSCPPSQIYLSRDDTPFDQFVEITSAHRPVWHLSDKKPEVAFTTAPLEESLLREGKRGNWDAYPILVAFYGTPVRLERLFMDDPERAATYFNVQAYGFYGGGSWGHFYLVMRLDEEGWAEGQLGLPFRFFGVLCSTFNEDAVEARFEKMEEAEIEKGLRFELLGVVETVEEGKVSVKPDWEETQLGDDGNREIMNLILQEGIEKLVVGEEYRFRGIISVPRVIWNQPPFEWRKDKLPDAVWKVCALEPVEL
jgi:hypothetical protein